MRPARPGPAAQIAGLIFAVLLVDEEQVVREANHAAEDLLGMGAKRMLGRPIAEIIEFDDERVRDRLSENDAQLTARGVLARIGERARMFNVTGSPLPNHPGWRVITLSDVGHVDGDGDEREGAVRTPAILAHEIKNPLSAIRGAGQLIARKLDEKDRPLAQMISDEVDRIAGLVDRMQRLGSEASEPLTTFNPHEALRKALGTVLAAGSEGVEVVEEFDPSLPPVLASREALEQVLINLISNARDACAGREGARVTLRTRFVSGLALTALRFGRPVRLPIEICVADNGPGIDPALRDHVFEPFVSSKKSGQGLGLALVRKLVRDMDGRIGHERDEKAGLTLFKIHLQVAK